MLGGWPRGGVWLARDPADMRKSFDGLQALVKRMRTFYDVLDAGCPLTGRARLCGHMTTLARLYQGPKDSGKC